MASYRLRVQLDDVPGALGAIAEALGRAGCNVLRVDVHGVDGAVAVDEFSVVVPPETSALDLSQVIAGAGGRLVAVGPLAVEGDVDPVTAALDAATWITRAPTADARGAELGRCLADLVGAEHGWVLPTPRASEPLFGRDAVAAPAVVHVSTCGGRGRDLRATIAMVPTEGALGVALRWGSWTYTSSELARAHALLRLGEHLDALPTGTPTAADAELVITRDGSFVAVRELDPADAAHLLDLDLRVSERSRRSRYLASRGLPSAAELRALTEVDGTDHLALGAWTEDGLVAEGRYVRIGDDPGSAELAILVADAHQRSGLGLLLVRELARRARERDIQRFVAHVAPSNDAMRQLLRRVTTTTITRVAHGAAEVLVPLDAIAAAPAR